MRWHDVFWIIGQEVRDDMDLSGIFGNAMRVQGTHEHIVPSLEWGLISDAGTELWEPCTIQFDLWTNTLEDLVLAEASLRALFDHNLPVTFEDKSGARDLVTWCEFQDGAELTSPDRSGYYGRAVRFQFTPLRDCLRRG